MPRTTRKTEDRPSPYIPSPLDACDEAADRLNAVRFMILHHDCCSDDPGRQHGGYDLSIVVEAIENVQRLLRESSKHAGNAKTKEARGHAAATIRQ